jgi:arylsulfatase A-like enzyme
MKAIVYIGNPILTILTILLLAPLAALHGADAPKPAAKPNIVFILIDDLPYAGMSLTGNPYLQTPNMDRLAKEGMFFTRAYSEILCAPSRATIMTGQSSARHGRTDCVPGSHPYARMQEPLLPVKPDVSPSLHFDLIQTTRLPDPVRPGTYSLVTALKAGGYRTAISGKWHLPGLFLTPAKARELGFDFCNVIALGGKPYKDTENFTDEALRFLRETRTQNFFLYLPYHAVHGPHVVPPEDTQRWKEKLKGQKPGLGPEMLASLEVVDRSVGRVLDALGELGLADNTLVVLAGDNGGEGRASYCEGNKPFRRGKGTLYEGGVRVPLLIRWPKGIAPGQRCDTPVQFADFFPTFCELAGVKVEPGHTLDGVSLKPLFSGGTLPERSIFLHYPHYLSYYCATPMRAVIQSRYKLVWHPYDHIVSEGEGKAERTLKYVAEPSVELFDLQADPGERQNLAQQQPERVGEMCRQFESWMKETGAKDVTPNPAYDAKNPLFNAREDYLEKHAEKKR